jgi:hypothetical protein
LEYITITKNNNLSISKTCKKNSNEKFGMCIQFLAHRLKRRSIAGLQEHILLQAAELDVKRQTLQATPEEYTCCAPYDIFVFLDPKVA